jgi:hypothetical protein
MIIIIIIIFSKYLYFKIGNQIIMYLLYFLAC